MIGGGMVWSAWYAGRVEGLPAEALQPLPRSLNLHNIFILSKYHFHLHIILTWSPCVLHNLVSICIGIHPPSPSSMNKRADVSEYFKQNWTGRCIWKWNCDNISIDIHLHCFSSCRQSSINKQNGCIGIGRKRDGPDVQTNSTLKLPFCKYKHKDKLMFFYKHKDKLMFFYKHKDKLMFFLRYKDKVDGPLKI